MSHWRKADADSAFGRAATYEETAERARRAAEEERQRTLDARIAALPRLHPDALVLVAEKGWGVHHDVLDLRVSPRWRVDTVAVTEGRTPVEVAARRHGVAEDEVQVLPAESVRAIWSIARHEAPDAVAFFDSIRDGA